MIDIQVQAENYAAHLLANDIKVLSLFPLKKRMNAQPNEFRLALFKALLGRAGGRHYGEDERMQLKRLHKVIREAGYVIAEVSMQDYVRKQYMPEIKAQTKSLHLAA